MGDFAGIVSPEHDSGSFRLNPGPTPSVFLGIAGKVSAGNGSEHIQLQCATQPEGLLDTNNRYRLRVVAKCRNAPVEVLLNMYVDATGVLQLEQASPSRTVSSVS